MVSQRQGNRALEMMTLIACRLYPLDIDLPSTPFRATAGGVHARRVKPTDANLPFSSGGVNARSTKRTLANPAY